MIPDAEQQHYRHIHFVTELCVYVDVVLVLFSLHTLDLEIFNNNVHTVIFCKSAITTCTLVFPE